MRENNDEGHIPFSKILLKIQENYRYVMVTSVRKNAYLEISQ